MVELRSGDNREIALVKPDGKCSKCGKKLKIVEGDHLVLKTKGYMKYYKGEKAIIQCSGCNEERIVSLN